MIKVSIYKNSMNCTERVVVSGHAGYAKHGEDIVCSAVSVLAQTILIGLVEVLKQEVEYEISEGYLEFNLENKNNNDSINALLDTFELGIENLLQDYGRYLKLIKEEVHYDDKN